MVYERCKRMIHEMLCSVKLVLASGSPRRRDLFAMLGLSPIIEAANVAEPLNNDPPELQAMHHATNKAKHVLGLYRPNHMIVAADTLVSINSTVLGKPNTIEEAQSYLRMLSGNQHEVFTGVCIAYNGLLVCDYECTEVSFSQMSDNDISAYIDTQEPFDKAGAYGIQGFGSQFISRVDGCYFNVMGFPVRKFYEMLLSIMGAKHETL